MSNNITKGCTYITYALSFPYQICIFSYRESFFYLVTCRRNRRYNYGPIANIFLHFQYYESLV